FLLFLFLASGASRTRTRPPTRAQTTDNDNLRATFIPVPSGCAAVDMGTSGRIRTYVQGFDDKLGGGVPPGHIVMVAGEAGTMKSTIAWSVLYNAAVKEHRTGAYITLEQSRDSFASHLKGMGMDPKEVEDKVSMVDLAMIRKNLEGMGESTWLEIFKMYAHNLKKSVNYDVLVVDSLTVLQSLARFERPREEM